MQKHILSGEDVAGLIDDGGKLSVFCEPVKKIWTGKLEPNDWPSSPGDVVEATPATELMAKSSPEFLMSVGIGFDVADALLT